MSFRFHPTATFFTVVGLAILIALGTWQLNRYFDAAQFEDERDARIHEPVVDVSPGELERLADGQLDFRRVTIRGLWDDERLFLIKHRIHDGHPGYWVVRPLLLFEETDDAPALPVNLGWLPREDVPEAAEALLEQTTQHSVSVTGLVHRLDDIVEDDDFRRSLDTDPHPEGLIELESYDIAAIVDATETGSVAQSVVLTRSPDDTAEDEPLASYDHIRDPYLTAETHFGYMLTWYILAVALFAIWLAHGFGLLRSRAYDD